MRILWLSNAPWSKTGYGNQTATFLPRLRALGHDVAVAANWGLHAGVVNWAGIPVYPRANHDWGLDILPAHVGHFGADVVISLVDAWIMDPRYLRGLRWAPWFPVDSEPMPPPVRTTVRESWQPVVFSRFGERMAERAGIEALYVPHGVDTKLLSPGDQREARERVHWPQDVFTVGMVAANKGVPSRKAFAEQIAGFKLFHERHPDSRLYLHSSMGLPGEITGVNLPELVGALGLTDRVQFADPYALQIGLPDEYMTCAYRAMDVLLSVSTGEGFGIPILEAQACGTPVIVGDWTAMSELCFAGWAIPKEEALAEWTPLAAYQWRVQPAAVAERLEAAYRRNAQQIATQARKARQGALEYDADRVTEHYWRPALAAMQQRIEDEKAAGPPAEPVALEMVAA